MSADDHPALFGSAGPVVGSATVPPEVARTAAALPPTVRLGTSSWSFPGWSGIVWDRRYDARTLAHHGLGAYGAHPLLRTVGVDRSFYAPLGADVFRRYASQVPDGFRFLVKAPAALTRPRRDDGSPNPCFLDPGWAAEHVVGPVQEGLGATAGPLVLQFSPFGRDRPDADAFAARLGRFLEALPPALVGVEVRDRQLLVPAYAPALRGAGAVHVVNVVPGMPTVRTQGRVAAAVGGPATVVRWMLRPDRRYREAKAAFAPFDRLVAPHPVVRDEIADLVTACADQPVWVIANNKAEGSAPLSLAALGAAIARCLAD